MATLALTSGEQSIASVKGTFLLAQRKNKNPATTANTDKPSEVNNFLLHD